eukprot:CAMPEP_0177652580 /NCGR_PEP_ID=MMETSP0447-20121125/13214_1 /TAXON_ID=0 /ORGANISM="Stygamoeba regulata, Strain BSH-02190019" /LENGTH=260 /DNA_ID=CAMNT_0019155851 /DNA_START=117 /DNA_END=899 /DNA_ORIENTATION=+
MSETNGDAASAAAGTKIFVGNLAFKTTEADLETQFSQVGKVKSANIISRGPRSLGYGFVEMEDEADAERCVEMMNQKEIDGRVINVELAKPREENAVPKPRVPGGRRGGFGRRRRASRKDDEAQPEEKEGDTAPVRGRRGGRGGRGGRGRGAAKTSNAQRAPSKTSLFVANLPYSMEDAGLEEIFKGLNITSAHVVKKKNGRSKGFGFVECADEAAQTAALEAINNKEIEGRALSVKVALTEPKNDGEEAAAEEAKPASE